MTISFSSQKWLDLLDELLGKEMDLHTFAPCKHVAKMQKLRSKSRAKVINVTFAYQHHRIVNKEANVEFAFPRSLSSFHNLSTNLHGASFCKSIFFLVKWIILLQCFSIDSLFFFFFWYEWTNFLQWDWIVFCYPSEDRRRLDRFADRRIRVKKCADWRFMR